MEASGDRGVLHAKIEGLIVERFFARVRPMSRPERRAMLVRDHPALSLSRQCRLPLIGRSSPSCMPKGESTETLVLTQSVPALGLKDLLDHQPCRQRHQFGAAIHR